MFTILPIEELNNGKSVRRKDWEPGKIMRLVTPDMWDGVFPLYRAYLMVKEENGWSIWCSCDGDLLLPVWEIVN